MIYIYIRILKNGVNITDDEFVVYLGKIELDTGEIVNIPPLHFKKYIYISKKVEYWQDLTQWGDLKATQEHLKNIKKMVGKKSE